MDEIKTAVEYFSQLPVYAQWVVLFIGAAKVLTPITPSQHKNPVLNAILKVLNTMALNVGKDKNADDQKGY